MGRLAERNKRAKLARRLRVPNVHEVRFVRALTGAMGEMHDKAIAWLTPKLGSITKNADAARADATNLSSDWDAEVAALIGPLAASVSPAFDEVAKAASKSNARVLRSLGLDVRDDLGPVLDNLRAWNVSLIKDAAGDFRDQVGAILSDPNNWGMRSDALSKLIQDRVDVSSSRATLIARDQTGKINGQINQHRQTHAGVSSYVWSSALDERVRDTHAVKEGQTFQWNAPPADTGAPGQDVNCRCVGLPQLPDEDSET